MIPPARILLVDDDRNLREVTSVGLRRHGFEVVTVSAAEAAVEAVREDEFDAVVTDLKMPGMGGMELLRRLHALQPVLPVVVLTAYGSIETAVQAMKDGAFDFATKPVDLDALALSLWRAVEHRRLTAENARLRAVVRAHGGSPRLITVAPVMLAVIDTVHQVADSDATVLITGESGTGKELVARDLHDASGRAAGPFVAVNCVALPEELLESELFGHVKGAFTGAVHDQPGRFRQADGGTLLLDEIGDMPPALQAKLLRCLESGEVDPVGSAVPVGVDARVIAATNVDLEARVAAGDFREDLYYRLNVIPIHLPPLRERSEDIALLADHFLREMAGTEVTVDDAARGAMRTYAWPGNVRELKNLCRRLALLTRGKTIGADDLPEAIRCGVGGGAPSISRATAPAAATLPEMERAMVLQALEDHQWNKAAAARALGIPRHVLLYRLQKYGIQPPPNP
ncbi:MAG: sigma-54 dependent transcriptional regulator [Nitrospirota bacterium]